MCDETFSVCSSVEPPKGVNAKYFYLSISVLDYLYWVTASFLGGVIGKLMTFNAEGLDFVLTALFVVLFVEGKKRPQVIDYISLKLPAAMMGLLVIYCLKGIDFSSAPFGAAEIIGVGVTAELHVWKRNVLLSIAVGTAVYMLLIRFVF